MFKITSYSQIIEILGLYGTINYEKASINFYFAF